MGNILSVQKVQKYYGNKASLTRALDVISFDVEQGEFLAIMGASGSGKTTLLNCISTIDKVTAGHIFVAGQDITGLKGKELNRFRRQFPDSGEPLLCDHLRARVLKDIFCGKSEVLCLKD